MEQALIHQHILVKARVLNAPKSAELLNTWLTELVAAIDMKICIEPRSVYVDTPGNRGLTGQVGIETSHIAIHVWDEEQPGNLQMDVYSCKTFDQKVVLAALAKFGMISYELMAINREKLFEVTDHIIWN